MMSSVDYVADTIHTCQMANSAEVLQSLMEQPPAAPGPIAYNFLVPNLKGLENFFKARDIEKSEGAATNASPQNSSNAFPTPPPSPKPSDDPAPISSSQDPIEMPSSISQTSDPIPHSTAPYQLEVSLFTAATEAFSKANTNCTIAESLSRCEPIVSLAKSKDIRVRGYVSVALGCPYEGPEVNPNKVAEITRTLLAMGADEVSVADTTGMGTAPKTQELMKALLGAGISVDDLALHFHDTYGQALVNILVGLENGVRTFDSSVGGLGGCPFSKGATGNVATEDLVHCLHSLGMRTGVSLEKMAEIGAWVSAELDKPNDSRAGKAILARMDS